MKIVWLVVWNIWIIFPYIGNNDPNWRTPSFFRKVGIPPTSCDFPSLFVCSIKSQLYPYGWYIPKIIHYFSTIFWTSIFPKIYHGSSKIILLLFNRGKISSSIWWISGTVRQALPRMWSPGSSSVASPRTRRAPGLCNALRTGASLGGAEPWGKPIRRIRYVDLRWCLSYPLVF